MSWDADSEQQSGIITSVRRECKNYKIRPVLSWKVGAYQQRQGSVSPFTNWAHNITSLGAFNMAVWK